MFILFVLTGLCVLVMKKTDLVPGIIFCQASIMAIVCHRIGLEVPVIVLIVTVKAAVIPVLLYYCIRKTGTRGHDSSSMPASVLVAVVLALFAAAYLFTRQLDAGPFAMAAMFTTLIGILCITSRKTLVGQLIGFIVLQNGIFAFTSSLRIKFPFAMELVQAVDVLFAVVVMIYAIQAIHKDVGSLEIKTFTSLRG